MKLTLNNIAYGTAIGLAGFSGAIATYGLTKFCPGSEIAVGVMGALFEAAKLSSLALIHRKHLPIPLKCGLGVISLTLMTANIAGVSGMLSAAYSERQNASAATQATATRIASASVGDLRKQLEATDATIADARKAVLRARDDKRRVQAANVVLAQLSADRAQLATRLDKATVTQAQGEGDAIRASGEFAAVRFLSQATGTGEDTMVHAVILVIASVPDIAAALLLWAAGHQPAKPARIVRRKRRAPKRRPKAPQTPALHVVQG
jgi:hypothetical protein